MKKIIALALIISGALISCSRPSEKIIIAHRGASGYLPEHTLAGKAMAFAMNPDYIEQDVALTKDDRAIVIHDMHLDTVTDVAKKFPARKRADGRFYAVDFTLAEIKTLRAFERIDLKTGKPVFAKRFPADKAIPLTLSTLEEEIELIQGLNISTGKNIGIYPELKSPKFHTAEKKNIAKIVIGILDKYGYNKKNSNCYVQCFDPDCLKYIRNELKSELKLIQLIADNSWDETPGIDYTKMMTPQGMKDIASYAEGIGPWLDQVIVPEKNRGYRITGLIDLAHANGLAVHPYTFRKDQLPDFVKTDKEYLDIILVRAGADGIFSDFPDVAVKYLRR